MSSKYKSARKNLSGDGLFRLIRSDFEKIPDYRQEAKVEISIEDALMSGLAVFSTKKPSLLQFERDMKDEAVASNLKNIYKIGAIPSDTQMRELIDPIEPSAIKGVFKDIFREIQRGKDLEQFEFLDGYYLASMDGTGYFSSQKVHCNNCQEKVNKKTGEVTYSHAMVGIAIVHPDKKQVIPLAPEPIIKQDGTKKNDCERNAGKRLLAQLRKDHPHLALIITEDALSPNVPHIKELQLHNMRFILSVKEGDHKFLFETVRNKREAGEVEEFEIQGDGVIHRFSYVNDVPLNESNQDVKVNFLEYWEIKENGRMQHFSWVTDISISRKNAYKLMRGGRARWRIENETFNTLKNKGYHFEHNFGHGYQNLSVNFALLMMLAFLVDQTQEICCKLFQAALSKAERKKYLWNKIRSLFDVLIFDSWEMLLNAIAFGFEVTKWKLVSDTS
jgi:hypothetical protein